MSATGQDDRIVAGAMPRVAVVGAGLMGRWHAHAARRIGASVVGVADPEPGRAARLAGSAETAFASLPELLRAVRPDILHVCGPTGMHREAIELALASGVHVFVEKPLALTAAETRELCDMAAAAKVVLCPVHQYAFQRAVERILAGLPRSGPPVQVEMTFFSAGAEGADPERLPALAADILPHPVSIAQRFWPGVRLATLDWKIEPMGPGGWQLSAPIGDASLRIALSFSARPTEASLVVRGSKGTWTADLFHGFARFRDGTASRATKALRPFADAFGLLGAASGNLAGRTLRREPAYPGLRELTARVYAAAQGAAGCPITAEEAVEVAALRDLFLERTVRQ
ncbi:MAG: Gfo/Idh/MocA family oxidoreductase [Proteobacteria bacterium]|nr:Gfo/Idh/MocA family oxidoreductase [Pseudomonadota bacterium]